MVGLPVRRSAQSNAIRTIGQWPDLRDDDPCTWTPGVSEVDDEEPDHDDGGPTSALVMWPVVLILCDNGSL